MSNRAHIIRTAVRAVFWTVGALAFIGALAAVNAFVTAVTGGVQ